MTQTRHYWRTAGVVLAATVLLAVPALAQDEVANEDLARAIRFFKQGAYPQAQAELLNINVNALSSEDRHQLEQYLELADLAITNFLEMRDHTGSAAFRRKKKLEQTLHKILGRRFVPLYSMISFSRLPYAQAIDLARHRSRLLVRWAGVVGILLLLLLAIIVLR